MKYRRFAYALLFAGMFFSLAQAQYPFTDDFSNPAQTSLNWSQVPADSFVRLCAGGVYTVTNTHKNVAYAGVVYHTFTARTPTFAASCVITRSADSIGAGLFVCLTVPTVGNISGYAVQLYRNGVVSIMKYPPSGNAAEIFSGEYHRQNNSDTLKVSKQGNTLYVFCNDVFIDSCVDGTNPIASGDFGLIVPGNSSVVFDNASFTNQATRGSYPREFADNFNNRVIDKRLILRSSQYFTENDSILRIAAPAATYALTDVRLDSLSVFFYSRMVVSWRSGDSVPFYGFYVFGPDSASTTPMAIFGIAGRRYCKAYLSSATSITPIYSQYIKGKAFVSGTDTTFWKDTIAVARPLSSTYYYMYVNGHKLDSIRASDIHYNLLGAGVFCTGGQTIGQTIFVDTFYVGRNPLAPVRPSDRKFATLTIVKFDPLTSAYLFDPLGRMLKVREMDGQSARRMTVPGFYISEKKKSGIIIHR